MLDIVLVVCLVCYIVTALIISLHFYMNMHCEHVMAFGPLEESKDLLQQAGTYRCVSVTGLVGYIESHKLLQSHKLICCWKYVTNI